MKELTAFKKLGLSQNCLEALAKKGFQEPTQIQERIIPLFMGKETDIIGQAQTGTGKTAAFGLPLIEKLKPGSRYPQAILAPPRVGAGGPEITPLGVKLVGRGCLLWI